jgi:hypothetical protein
MARHRRSISGKAAVMPRTHDATGRTRKSSGNINVAPGSAPRFRRRNKITGQFAWRTIEMLESPAMSVLSLSARRLLDRLEIELAHHGGRENGKLPVTYEQLVEFGLHRHCIAPAIREVEALGFTQVTEHGRGGNAEYRKPNLYRITYRPTDDGMPPTDNWRRIKSIEEATALALEARQPRLKKQNTDAGFCHVSVSENGGENAQVPPPENGGTGPPPETITTSISPGGPAVQTQVYRSYPLSPQHCNGEPSKLADVVNGILAGKTAANFHQREFSCAVECSV